MERGHIAVTALQPRAQHRAGLSKSFPGLRALDNIDFAVRSGEIAALVGQNGSGESTLVEILAGVDRPDPGGRISFGGPADAPGRDGPASVHVIHQDLGLIPQLYTVENLDLGWSHGARTALTTRPRAEAERAGRLFAAVCRVASRGAGVIFVSHRLDEVMDLAAIGLSSGGRQGPAAHRRSRVDPDLFNGVASADRRRQVQVPAHRSPQRGGRANPAPGRGALLARTRGNQRGDILCSVRH
jgi:ABC-type taurine transport system ATPase subunit